MDLRKIEKAAKEQGWQVDSDRVGDSFRLARYEEFFGRVEASGLYLALAA